MKIIVKGMEWQVRVLADAAYKKRFGTDSVALTDADDFTIHVKKSALNLLTLRHELLHSYVASCLTGSSSLNALATEELCCEIVAYHLQDIEDTATQCLKQLTGKPDDRPKQ